MRWSESQFRERFGPWALVAGGSVGLGAEYVRQLAGRGLDLVVVAESDAPLERFCAEVARECGVRVHPVVTDLASADLLEQLQRETAGREIGLVVCNAAHSPIGGFLEQSRVSLDAVIAVNCRAPLLLAHGFAPAMVARGRGGLIFMSSLAGLQGTPQVAAYAASKAFNAVLGESLWQEFGRRGVDVLAVCPGATRTPGWEQSQPDRSGRLAPPVQEPREVVADALASLGRGPRRIPGRANRWAAGLLNRALPRSLAVRAMGRAMRAQYGPLTAAAKEDR